MIVLKNIFKQDDFTGKLEFDGQYKFRIKDSIFIVNKKMTFFEKIFSYNMQEDKKTENCSSLSKPESNDNNCLNISDSNYQSENSQKETLLQNQKYDENQSDDFLTSFEEESSYSDEYSFDDNFQERKNIENTEYKHEMSDYDIRHKKDFNPVVKSNYDGKDIKYKYYYSEGFGENYYGEHEIFDSSDYEANEDDTNTSSDDCESNIIDTDSIQHTNESTSIYDLMSKYYTNSIYDISNMTFKSPGKPELEPKEIAKKQFQLFLEGHDIVITDFIIDWVLYYAKIFDITELITAISKMQTEMKNDDNDDEYSAFTELEILQKIENIFDTIDEDTFSDNSSLILSLYLYIGGDLFESILIFFAKLHFKKIQLYSKIAQMIKSRYNFNKISFFEPKDTNDFPKFFGCIGPQKYRPNFLPSILIDDVDSLQKLINNDPQFNIDKTLIDLKKNDVIDTSLIYTRDINLIQCSALFGSVKCFKYLFLNFEIEISGLAWYAVAGGNVEIIHICEQNNFNFRRTLNAAFTFHRTNIAEWIIDNNKDEIDTSNYLNCIETCNFNFLPNLIYKNIENFSDKSQIIFQYILYTNERIQTLEKRDTYGRNDICSYVLNYLIRGPFLKDTNPNRLLHISNEKLSLIYFLFNEKTKSFDSQLYEPNNIFFITFISLFFYFNV